MPTSDSGRARRRFGCLGIVLAIIAGLVVAGWLTRTQPLLGTRCIATANGQDHELEPDQARNAALISAVATKRGLPARASSIAIATAIQESKLRNIDYGDRDSLGLFQQRPSQGWGTPEQIMDPIYSTNKFYDTLVKIDGWETMVITEVAQKVQRSAFPDAYGFHEPDARAYASSLTGHSPAALSCDLRSSSVEAQSPGADGLTARAVTVRDTLDEELGARATKGGSANELVVQAPSSLAAWQSASWAVASAADLEITAVTVGQQTWTRGEKGWTGAQPKGSDGATGATGATATAKVTITVA